MTLWLKVTKDKYQLPMIVADSCKELADKSGVHITSVFRNISRDRKNKNIPSEYIKVEVEDE